MSIASQSEKSCAVALREKSPQFQEDKNWK